MLYFVKMLRQKLSHIGVLLIGCGMVLIAASWIWPFHTFSKTAWSDEQAKAYAVSSQKFHQLSHQNIHPQEQQNRLTPLQTELSEAKIKYQQLRQQLDHARSRPKRFSGFASGLGIVLVAGGCLLWIVNRNTA